MILEVTLDNPRPKRILILDLYVNHVVGCG